MNSTRFVATVAALSFATQSFAQTAPANTSTLQSSAPTPLAPAGPWNVRYDQNECVLVREFGEAEHRLALRIARASSLDYFDVVLGGPGLVGAAERGGTNVTLDPQGTTESSDSYSMDVPGTQFKFLRLFDIRAPFLSQMQPDQLLTIRSARFSTTLRLTRITAAMAALQTCHDDLLTSWGFDAVSYRALAAPPNPTNDQSNWVTSGDYPSRALSQNAQGTSTALLTVGVEGRVTACRIIVSSGNVDLDEATCRLFSRRARFTPALGQDRQPVSFPYIRRVRWQLPDR